MSRRIKSISFLFEDRRLVLKASADGTFRLPFESKQSHRGYSPKGSVYYRNLTARQVIEDPRIKSGDPVLTLTNGEKIRVFQGGDPTYLPAHSEGTIQRHDSIRTSGSGSYLKSESGANQFEFDWGLGMDDDWF